MKLLFANGFSDAQCGFKAIKCGVAQELLPHLEDEEWFFDTELLLLAEERGYRVSEVPVDWIEDLDSRVGIASTARKDVKGLLRVRAQRLRRLFEHRRSHTLNATHRAQPGGHLVESIDENRRPSGDGKRLVHDPESRLR